MNSVPVRHVCAAVAIGTFATTAFAGITLAADDDPADTPWNNPATLSYVGNGDGTSSATADAVLRYKSSDVDAMSSAATQSRFSAGVYIHRDTDSSAPRNDRGVQVSYGQFIVRDGDNASGVRSLNWLAKLSMGNSLQAYKDANGVVEYSDRTKDRQLIQISGYYQPALAGVPPHPGSNDRPPLIMFFDGFFGAYSDNNSGGSGKGTGRLTGAMMGLGANIAPLGLDPAFNQLGSIGVVPTIRFAAQVQRDASASNERPQDTYKLFTLALSLAFAKLGNGGGLVPSLNFSRTVGADLLAGRPDTTKTEVSLGLTF
jgi:hypothetical protein